MYKFAKRRDFLKVAGVLASSLLVPTGLSAYENRSTTIVALKDSIINDEYLIIKESLNEIDLSKNLNVKYEVSIDKSFNTIVYHDEYLTHKDKNFNLKINTKKLDSGIRYYYRLSAYNEESAYWFNTAGNIHLI